MRPWTADIGDKSATIHERDTGRLIAMIRLGGAEGYDHTMKTAALVAAAAPEMLEALKKARSCLHPHLGFSDEDEAFEAVLAAIAKAEGR